MKTTNNPLEKALKKKNEVVINYQPQDGPIIVAKLITNDQTKKSMLLEQETGVILLKDISDEEKEKLILNSNTEQKDETDNQNSVPEQKDETVNPHDVPEEEKPVKEKTFAELQAEIDRAYKERLAAKTVEDTHTRYTFLMRDDLKKRLDKHTKNKKRGEKHRILNAILENYLDAVEGK